MCSHVLTCAQMCPPRFERVFVSVRAAIDVALACGMGFSAIDACHSKHIQYRSGMIHMLTTRDGNNKLLPLAWAICETESGGSYEYFAHHCQEAGLDQYLNQDNSVLYSDRDKGVPIFHDAFTNCNSARCFKHIIANCRSALRKAKCAQKFSDAQAWAIQKATTYEQFEDLLHDMYESAPMAAEYFGSKVHHAHAYQYAFQLLGVATHGHKTSNTQEIINGVFNNARTQAPYRFNDLLLRWIGEKLFDRNKAIKAELAKQRRLTPYSRDLWMKQVTEHICIDLYALHVCVRAQRKCAQNNVLKVCECAQ